MSKVGPKTPHNTTVADALIKQLTWQELDPIYLRKLVEIARDEDLNGLGLLSHPRITGDRSTDCIAGTPRIASADLVARESLVVCGLPLLGLILSVYGRGATVQLRIADGARVEAGGVLATLAGDPRVLLAAERIVLNFLQRLSGIATQTRIYVDALGKSRTRLLDTRKTTPGYRMLEKYAVACGGGWNHRLGLFDRVMLKDNHLALLGSTDGLADAVARAKRPILLDPHSAIEETSAEVQRIARLYKFDKNTADTDAYHKYAPVLPVEVEVDRMDQIAPVLSAGVDVILLDNFSPTELQEAVTLIGGRAFTEASGGITLKTLPKLAGIGLDFVSTGALVHQSIWVDIGLDWNTSK